ncbi:MAG: metal ABC transporter substrate-binding protein [Thaumarchaeota archaeon]|nr:metal ABC transporter substrate-binding protein [Candidatus Geocrenenecus arthurdayi]
MEKFYLIKLKSSFYPVKPRTMLTEGKNVRTRIVNLILIALFILFQIGSVNLLGGSANEEKILVAAVVTQLASVVREVGGEKIEVETILPPYADPHHYEPSMDSLLNTLSKAKLVVTTGSHHLAVEEKIYQVINEGLVKVRVIGLPDYERKGLTLLINPKTGDVNIHEYYYSIKNLKAIASAITEELIKVDSTNKQYYAERLNNYLSRLNKIEETISLLSKNNVYNVRVITYTPLMQYVIEDLGLKLVDVVVSEVDVEPSEKDFSNMLTRLINREADYILFSDIEAIENPKLLDLLSRQGVRYYIIPLSSLAETPELASLSTAILVSSSSTSYNVEVESPMFDIPLVLSILANVVLLSIIILLIIKVRRHGG